MGHYERLHPEKWVEPYFYHQVEAQPVQGVFNILREETFNTTFKSQRIEFLKLAIDRDSIKLKKRGVFSCIAPWTQPSYIRLHY
jgi:hypothetical protein